MNLISLLIQSRVQLAFFSEQLCVQCQQVTPTPFMTELNFQKCVCMFCDGFLFGNTSSHMSLEQCLIRY